MTPDVWWYGVDDLRRRKSETRPGPSLQDTPGGHRLTSASETGKPAEGAPNDVRISGQLQKDYDAFVNLPRLYTIMTHTKKKGTRLDSCPNSETPSSVGRRTKHTFGDIRPNTTLTLSSS